MYIADLHIHSRFSRATSKDGDAPHLEFWARRKGIQLIGTGDFTHPAWRAELKEQLVPAEEGLYTCLLYTSFGGLTAVRELIKLLPGEDIIYFGDTGRVPYGSKSRETIKKYALQDSRFLLSMGVKYIIVALSLIHI